MAVNRVWFPNAPTNGVAAPDRSQVAIGYPLGNNAAPTPISIDENYLRRYLNDVANA